MNQPEKERPPLVAGRVDADVRRAVCVYCDDPVERPGMMCAECAEDAGEPTGSCDDCGVDIYEADGNLCDHCEWAAMGGCYDVGYDADDSEWLAEYE